MRPVPVVFMFLGAIVLLSAGARALERASQAGATAVPVFQVDPLWPKMPKQWILGQVSGVAVDARDHVWVLQRPWSLNNDEKSRNPEAECCQAGPPVMEFDAAGNYVRGWGGQPADNSYEWPMDEHGIHVDYKGNVWVSSAGGPRMKEGKENFLLKFTAEGKFLLQIGRRGMSKGSLDTKNVNNAADMWVHPPTNEVFVADGYINRRVLVLDADTGAFKRMWGAFGNEPVDKVTPPAKVPEDQRIPAREATGPGPDQFITPVHAVRVSRDGLVYVSDRGGKRVQVFTLAGKYVTQVFIDRYCEVPHCGNGQTVASTAFSHDPEQRFLYVASRSPARVWVLDRKTLEPLDSFGRPGVAPGEFYVMHHMNVDAKGNLYVTEVQDGKRIQKFVFKGYSTTP
jgi:hypothetical protein